MVDRPELQTFFSFPGSAFFTMELPPQGNSALCRRQAWASVLKDGAIVRTPDVAPPIREALPACYRIAFARS